MAIGRDEKSMKRRVGEDKGGRTRTEMCISEEQWSDRASSTGEREREREKDRFIIANGFNPAFRTS